MKLTLFLILICTAALSWWMSGFDSKVNGHDQAADFKRRSLRCAITLVLVGIGSWQFMKGDIFNAFICVLVMLPLAPFWMSCVSEWSSGGVMHLVDRPDDRELDPKQIGRDLDRLAALVRDGRNHEAIELCGRLLECNEASALAIETNLFELYQEMLAEDRLARSTPLADVLRLRKAQRFNEGIGKLEALLKKQPHNIGAAFLLMRIHAEDLRDPESARRVLQSLHPRASIPPAFAEFAGQRIKEWSGMVPRRQKSAEGIESLLVRDRPSPAPKADLSTDSASVEDLLAAGQLTSAIEILECKVDAQPQDFESWLKLAEAHGAYCQDLLRAKKIIEKIAANSAFDANQVRLAKMKFREWKAACTA